MEHVTKGKPIITLHLRDHMIGSGASRDRSQQISRPVQELLKKRLFLIGLEPGRCEVGHGSGLATERRASLRMEPTRKGLER